jgi:membrane protease YdiL (CAAX protease family)
VLPALTWAGARLLGGERDLDAGLVASLALNLVTATLVVNLWEELAWTGFYQRRATRRWGRLRGSAATAALFAGVHLPLAFDGADGPGEVAANVAALAVAGLGLRLLIAGVDAWSRGSLLTVAVLHASFNAAGDLVASGHDWVRYALVLALGLLVLATPDPTVRRVQRGERRLGAVR